MSQVPWLCIALMSFFKLWKSLPFVALFWLPGIETNVTLLNFAEKMRFFQLLGRNWFSYRNILKTWQFNQKLNFTDVSAEVWEKNRFLDYNWTVIEYLFEGFWSWQLIKNSSLYLGFCSDIGQPLMDFPSILGQLGRRTHGQERLTTTCVWVCLLHSDTLDWSKVFR